MNKQEIQRLLDPYDLSHLDSDGCVRVFAWLLKQANVEFTIKLGSVQLKRQTFYPHCWIELENGLIVDYRTHTWVPDAPCGVFRPEDYAGVLYLPEKEPDIVVTRTMFKMLTRIAVEGDEG